MNIRLEEYIREDGGNPYQMWFNGLDAQAAAKVTVAKTRLELGTNLLESIVIFMRQYGHEMQKNFGRSQARSWGASGDAAASCQGDS
jgi:hypothetical protein